MQKQTEFLGKVYFLQPNEAGCCEISELLEFSITEYAYAQKTKIICRIFFVCRIKALFSRFHKFLFRMRNLHTYYNIYIYNYNDFVLLCLKRLLLINDKKVICSIYKQVETRTVVDFCIILLLYTRPSKHRPYFKRKFANYIHQIQK